MGKHSVNLHHGLNNVHFAQCLMQRQKYNILNCLNCQHFGFCTALGSLKIVYKKHE